MNLNTKGISLSFELNMLRLVYDFLDIKNKVTFLESLKTSSYRDLFKEFSNKSVNISIYDTDYFFISIKESKKQFFLPIKTFNTVKRNLIYLANNQKTN